VGKRKKDISPQLFTELDDFFRMTGRTKPATPTGKGQQVLMVAVRTKSSKTVNGYVCSKFGKTEEMSQLFTLVLSGYTLCSQKLFEGTGKRG
jgi:hypothetical protein